MLRICVHAFWCIVEPVKWALVTKAKKTHTWTLIMAGKHTLGLYCSYEQWGHHGYHICACFCLKTIFAFQFTLYKHRPGAHWKAQSLLVEHSKYMVFLRQELSPIQDHYAREKPVTQSGLLSRLLSSLMPTYIFIRNSIFIQNIFFYRWIYFCISSPFYTSSNYLSLFILLMLNVGHNWLDIGTKTFLIN